MTIPDVPPRGLRWTTTATAKGFTTLIAMVALVVAALLGIQQQLYIHCVGTTQQADARRTSAVAAATDVERAADAALIAGPQPGGPDITTLRAMDQLARTRTDAVRAANPPEAPGQC